MLDTNCLSFRLLYSADYSPQLEMLQEIRRRWG
jgi:hypothetical protein